ncbi:MAG: shikimate kinase [Xanthobacteraceae bacterium]|nr:MAG: shikimate kinase [Xanthobacteraceae bacterium]
MSDSVIRRDADACHDAAVVAALGRRPVVLIGMMGAGKTSIGKRLAARLQLPFVDADHEIEQAAGMSIADIFASHGEPYFRDGEARVIARLIEGGPCVLATGGGAYMRAETRERIHAKGVALWLKAEVDVILRRVRRRSDRPLLQTEDQAATIARLVDERYPVYASADITVLSRDEPHERIVQECVEALHHLLCPGEASAPARNATPAQTP